MSRRKLLIGAGYALAAVAMLYALGPESEPAPVSYEVAPAAEIASRARLERALDKRVKLHFDKTPLDEAVKQISAKVGIPVQIDVRSLEDARHVLEDDSFRADQPITLDVSGVSLRRALKLLLNPHDLIWSLHNDAVMIRARDTDCASNPMVMIYPVRDLVLERTAGEVNNNYQPLIDTITAVVVPTTWDEVGGSGSIHADPVAGALVIWQSREYQAQIELLLTALRKSRDAQGIVPGETLVSSPVAPPARMGSAAVQVGKQPSPADPSPSTAPAAKAAVPTKAPRGSSGSVAPQ